MDTKTKKLAAHVNVQWRKWRRADEARFKNPYSDAALQRSVKAIQDFHKAVTETGLVFDHQNGETFSVTDEAGELEYTFRFNMKGDPIPGVVHAVNEFE